jgi:potassium/hydrogen antiporter
MIFIVTWSYEIIHQHGRPEISDTFTAMTGTIIITFCSLLLIAYVFDLTSSRTRIPSVILLLLLGWLGKRLTQFLDLHLPDFSSILPVLGTVGLILIVLEGSLELELNKTKTGLVRKSSFGALVPMMALSFLLAFLFSYVGNTGFKDSLVNAIPFSVISSAIAIPSVRNLEQSDKEFVIYESSLSDISGVLLFNFIALNETINFEAFGHFGLGLLIILVVSFMATIGLSFLLNKIEHHVKFVPIILLIILIYTVSKVYHLPALVFILTFGLFMGNLKELKRFKWINRFQPEELSKEVQKFKELTIEAAFLIRALFFLLFGFLLETADILRTDSLGWTLTIVFIIFISRTIQLKVSALPLNPLLFIAPRGLITILLFLSVDPAHRIPFVNNSLVIQVIILTILIMMIGLTKSKRESANPD